MRAVCIGLVVVLLIVIEQSVAIRRIKRFAKRNAEEEHKGDKKASKMVDIGALLESGKPLSIKSTETDTMDENGKTNKRIKELQIGTSGDPSGSSSEETSSLSKENKDSDSEGENLLKGLVSIINTGLANASLTHINSPLSTSKGVSMSEYPSIHEISKETNENQSIATNDINNHHSEAEESALQGTNGTKAETEGASVETSKLAGNGSHAGTEAIESNIAKVAGGNQSHAEPETAAIDGFSHSQNQSHTEAETAAIDDSSHSQNQSHAKAETAAIDGYSHPENQSHVEAKTATEASHLSKNESNPEAISNALSAESTPVSNKSVSADSKHTGGNQIALVPISLPISLISQLQGALKNQSGLSGNTTSDPSLAALTSDKTHNSNETSGLRRDSENSFLNSGKGTGQGIILLANILNDKPGTKKSETDNAVKKFDIDVTIEEEPDENTDIEEDDDE